VRSRRVVRVRYPEFAEFLGIPLAGQVLDAHTVDKDGRPALCLWVNQFAGALPESVGGFSGTPVLAGKRLLGQLFRVLGAEDGWQKPHLAICYATPPGQWLGSWPRLVPPETRLEKCTRRSRRRPRRHHPT